MLNKFKTSLRSLASVLFISLGMLILPACDQDLVLNLRHSINIFHAGPKWPNVKKLTPAQQRVYQTMGKPDCFRVYYNSVGEIKIRQILEKELNGKKPDQLPPYSWVYLKDNKEVVFTDNENYTERPLNDAIHLVIKYGDPEDVKFLFNGEITQWTFYSVGKIYNLKNNTIVDTKEFPPMGKYRK